LGKEGRGILDGINRINRIGEGEVGGPSTFPFDFAQGAACCLGWEGMTEKNYASNTDNFTFRAGGGDV
jgi:hypothetical protein